MNSLVLFTLLPSFEKRSFDHFSPMSTVDLFILLVLFRSVNGWREMRVAKDSNATLHCNPVRKTLKEGGQSEAEIRRVEWRKNGAIIASYQQSDSTANPTQWWVSSPKMHWVRILYSLSLTKVDIFDTAVYECFPRFKKFRTHKIAGRIRLIVIDRPVPPSRTVVTSFTSRSISLSWSHSDSSAHVPILRYMVLASVGTRPDTINGKLIYGNGNGSTLVVSSLRPYTIYTLQVIAENQAGKSKPGTFVTVRTKGEAPVAAPVILHIRNGTNDDSPSLIIDWEAPKMDTLHGSLISFLVRAHRSDESPKQQQWHRIGFDLRKYELEDLQVYSRYTVSVQAQNDFGYSPIASRLVTTIEGVPSTGPDITGVRVQSSSQIEISWVPPKESNGILRSYAIYHRPAGRKQNTTMIKLNNSMAVVDYTIENLKAYMKYFIWATASTAKGESDRSELNHVFTDTAAPSAPLIQNMTLTIKTTVLIIWSRPDLVHRKIDKYTLVLIKDDDSKHTINTSNLFASIQLAINIRYKCSVFGTTNSIVDRKKSYKGRKSIEHAIMITYDSESGFILHTSFCDIKMSNVNVICDKFLLAEKRQPVAVSSNFSTLLLLLLASLVFCALSAFILRRNNCPSKSELPEMSYISAISIPYDEIDCPSISVSNFALHVKSMQKDNNAGFVTEFLALDNYNDDEFRLSEISTLEENKSRNRYTNIVAYDHSRVKLRSCSHSDYINANFVDGFHKTRAYIATQGPLPSTFVDFWRMVWEQRTKVIVMITNIVEQGRKKCDRYWPSNGAELYGGQFQVRLVSERQTAHFTIRMLSLKNCKSMQRVCERTVVQLHFTDWPDHGVPPSPLPVLTFIRKSAEFDGGHSGPLVVHCSAGVGRSGTYIVIDSMLRQIKQLKSVNIFAFVRHIRHQRNFLVQTEEQYAFCYKAILVSVQMGCTQISRINFRPYVDRVLPAIDISTGKTQLQLLYNLVCTTDDVTSCARMAQLLCNIRKNRNFDSRIPTDLWRVVLSKRSTDFDYINASFFPGYHKMDEFIVTQWPLNDTVDDFWQMIWQYNVQTIVILCPVERPLYGQFWPDIDDVRHDYYGFHLQRHSCTEMSLHSDDDDDFQLDVHLEYHPLWSNGRDEPWSLLRSVADRPATGQNGPTVVVDQFGWTEAARFCILSTAMSSLKEENAVDVHQMAVLYNQRKPAIWNHCDDYKQLYDSIVQFLHNESCSLGQIHPMSINCLNPSEKMPMLGGDKN